MKKLLFQPRPVILTDTALRREPIRPLAHRPPDFADQFDDETLIFDAISGSEREVRVLTPPFFNLLPAVEAMEVVARPSRERCAFRITRMDRHAQIRFAVPTGTTG